MIENRASRGVTEDCRDLESIRKFVLLGADDLATLPQGEANDLIEDIGRGVGLRAWRNGFNSVSQLP